MIALHKLFGLFCVLSHSLVALAFIWQLDEVLPPQKYFTFSERYMFADRGGPLFLDRGPSFIKIDMDITVFSRYNRSTNIGIAVYATSEGHHDSQIDGMCEDNTYPNAWASNVITATFPTSYLKTVHMESSQLGLNGTYHVFSLKVDYQYTVQKEAWHNVVFLMCPGYNYLTTDGGVYSRNNTIESQDSFMLGGTEAMGMTNSRVLAAALGAAPVKTSTAPAPTGSLTRTVTGMMMTPFSPTSTSTSTSQPTVGQHQLRRLGQTKESMGYLSGTIAFHNPYGYIPAEMFGLLPFQIARVVAYAFFAAFFVTHYCQHRETTLALHNGFLLIFLFAFIEAMLWFASYEVLNHTGVPYCCPFPPLVVASLVLQVVRQTLARSLLLVVCLGYGIVRPKLMTAEWSAVAVVSVLYMVCAFISQGAVILFAQEAHGNYGALSRQLLPYKLPEMFMDVLFLSWIYLAVGSTIRILTEFQQTVKLDMYKQLVYIIGVFIALFAAVTVVFMLDATVVPFMPWQCAWLEQVLWESLNFAVLAAVCIVCRPTANSQMLSYASQLPTEDPDLELDDCDELHGGGAIGAGFKSRSQNSRSQNRGNRPYVYEQDDEGGDNGSPDVDLQDYYEVGSNSRNGGSKNGAVGADGTDGYNLEMSELRRGGGGEGGATHNPITSIYNRVQAAISSTSSSNAAERIGGTGHSHEFGRLPTAEDEEYGLEQDD